MDLSNMSEKDLGNLEEAIAKQRTHLFSLKPRFLPEDVRNEVIQYLMETDYEVNNYIGDDYSLTSDHDITEEYEDMVNQEDEQEDTLLQKLLGYREEYNLLSTTIP